MSRRISTTAARVRAQIKSFRIYGIERDAGAGFLQVLLFLLHLIPPVAPNSLIYILFGAGTAGQMADVPSEFRLAAPPRTLPFPLFSIM
jgi:hypothetical protein